MDFRGKKVLVFGTGISGIGAGELLERAGASVILYDGNESLDREKLRKHFAGESSVEILLGSLPMEVMDQLELVVLSPGVPTDLPVVNQLREREIANLGRSRTCIPFRKRRCTCDHRNKREDNDNRSARGDYEGIPG